MTKNSTKIVYHKKNINIIKIIVVAAKPYTSSEFVFNVTWWYLFIVVLIIFVQINDFWKKYIRNIRNIRTQSFSGNAKLLRENAKALIFFPITMSL